MDWSDEKYVKLYSRDTLTWLSWSWQAKAVFALLLRKVDGAGIMETGTLDRAQAVAMQLSMPAEVVRPGLDDLIRSGTVEAVKGGVLLPNFVAAQESSKTEARKKRDQRERKKDQRRAEQVAELREMAVPACPVVSPLVPLQPSPAQPSPAQPRSLSLTRAADQTPAAARQMRLDGAPDDEPEERSKSIWETTWAEMCFDRRWAVKTLGGLSEMPDESFDEEHSPAFLNTALKRAAAELNTDAEGLLAVWNCYLEGTDFANKEPPWPLKLFLSHGVLHWAHKQHREAVEGAALEARR